MIAKCVVAVLCLVAATTAASVSLSEGYNNINNNEKQSGRTDMSHNLIVGTREYSDREVHREHVTKSSSWWRIVTLEKTITIHGATKITEVDVLDQKTNGNGAYATIRGGGPGFNYVTLKFKSQRSHGINFQVVIFAK